MRIRLFKRPPTVLVALAEEISDELATLTAPLEACAWEIDSALSSLRKDAAGYRKANAANPTGGDSYTDGELEKAVARGKAMLLALSAVRELEARWTREDNADAARRTGLQGNLAFRPCASRA
jgi:hypothetical protein